MEKKPLISNAKRNYSLVLFGSIDRTLSSATTPDQSEPRSDDNEGVLHIPKSSSITRTSKSDYLMSRILVGGSVPLCRDADLAMEVRLDYLVYQIT